MLSVGKVFEKLDLGTSPLTAVQQIRLRVESSKDIKAEAEKVVFEILGITRVYESDDQARLIAMSIGDEAFKLGCEIPDELEFLTRCEARIAKFMANPANAFMFVKPVIYQAVATEMKQVVAEVETKVAVKADGTLKKGGKEQIAFELYQKFVLDCKPEDALDNQGVIKMLIAKLNMTPKGATTYAYNARKKLGEPVGGLKRSKKGRKKK